MVFIDIQCIILFLLLSKLYRGCDSRQYKINFLRTFNRKHFFPFKDWILSHNINSNNLLHLLKILIRISNHISAMKYKQFFIIGSTQYKQLFCSNYFCLAIFCPNTTTTNNNKICLIIRDTYIADIFYHDGIFIHQLFLWLLISMSPLDTATGRYFSNKKQRLSGFITRKINT